MLLTIFFLKKHNLERKKKSQLVRLINYNHRNTFMIIVSKITIGLIKFEL